MAVTEDKINAPLLTRINQKHKETMTALRQQGEALRSVSEGIREMIARTRPA